MKKIFILLLIMICTFPVLNTIEVQAFEGTRHVLVVDDYTSDKNECGIDRDDFCANFSNAIVIVGYLIILLKIALPLIIIVKTTINLLPLITSGNPDNFKKAMTSILISFVAAVLIFFLPTILNIFLGFTNKYDEEWETQATCHECVLNATGENCQKYVDLVNECKKIKKEG